MNKWRILYIWGGGFWWVVSGFHCWRRGKIHRMEM